MKKKFNIFVALAILMQYFCAHLVKSELSEMQLTELQSIRDHQDTALSLNLDATSLLFDVLEMFSAMRKYNLNCKTDDISSMTAEALFKAYSGSDHIFDSIPMILGTDCSAAEIARNASYVDLKNVYAQIDSAIELAVSGNCTDIGTRFEVFSIASNKSLGNCIKRIHDTIRTCVSTTNDETLAAIEVRENGSLNGLLSANDAVFDAIKIVAAGIPAEGDDVAIVPDIKFYRKRAASGVKDVAEHSFSSIRGIYISRKLNRPEIAAHLTSNQYAHIVGDSNYMRAAEIMFDVIRGYLTKVRLGLSDACDDDSSAIDAAQAETAAYFRAGLDAIAESVSTPNSETSTAAAAGLKFVNKFSVDATAMYYKAIRLARGQGSSCSPLKKIQTIEDGLKAAFPNFARALFSEIPQGSITKGGLTNFQNNVADAGQSYVDKIFTGIRVMAKACRKIKPVSENDFNALETAKNEINDVVRNFTSNTAFGHVTAM